MTDKYDQSFSPPRIGWQGLERKTEPPGPTVTDLSVTSPDLVAFRVWGLQWHRGLGYEMARGRSVTVPVEEGNSELTFTEALRSAWGTQLSQGQATGEGQV